VGAGDDLPIFKQEKITLLLTIFISLDNYE